MDKMRLVEENDYMNRFKWTKNISRFMWINLSTVINGRIVKKFLFSDWTVYLP